VQFTPDLRERIQHHLDAFEPALLSAAGLHHAAVGVVLLPDRAGRACFVLTRRLTTLRRHAGQWALPGGRLEADETPQQAALREIHEEINVDLSPSAIVGRLDDFVSRSGHLISPIVLWAPDDTEPAPSPDEVDAAFRIPLDELDDPHNLRLQPLLHFAMPSVETTVHAPTAALLYQFREVALHGRHVRIDNIEQPFFAWS
jgi:8-oxo-dGTP pyrophosphatase MutT (NUDIX family)